MAGEDSTFSKDLSQGTYTPTPYEDQAWEVVGEFSDSNEFLPEEFQVVSTHSHAIDPMFADYGGLPPPSLRRWHVPEAQQMAMNPEHRHEPTQVEEEDHLRVRAEELELIRAEAREEGRISALAEAVENQTAQLENLRTQLARVLQDLESQFAQQLGLVEKQAIELAVQISRKIIVDAVELNPEYIVPLIKEAIEQSGTARITRVRVSPEDLEFISLVGIEKHVKNSEDTWRFEADPSIKSGCVLDSSAGEIDYQLDKAWERLRDQILKVKR